MLILAHRPARRGALVVAIALVVAGCGDGAATGSSDTVVSPATDPEVSVPLPDPGTPVVQLRTQAMFPVTPPFLPTEWTTIDADGTVLVPFRGNFAALPQVWPFEIGHVEVGEVTALLADAAEAGLLDPPAGVSTDPSVADAPRTTLIITTAAGTVTHVADALAVGDQTDPYRAALQAFTGEVADVVMRATAKPDDDSTWPVFYEPDALDVVAVEVTADAPGPGTSTVIDWTVDAIDLAALAACTTVTDADGVSFLVGQLAGPMYRQGDHLYRVASRIHPPGTSCDA
jgi:hypothetical protein